jgi:hypothetical protein
VTKAEYVRFHAECCERMKEITAAKNADYTGGSADPFANFTDIEREGICTTEQGFMVRMKDKFARIRSFIKLGVLQVKDETITDTLLDLANYCILLAGYIKSKKAAREAALFNPEEEGGEHGKPEWERRIDAIAP